MSVYRYSYTSIEGKEISFSDYRDTVILIVNTASKCGFTKQYKSLEEIYKKYKDQNFTIIGFPCNQFGEQEKGSNQEIQEFCSVRYGVTFPLSQKVDVRDEDAIPIYKFLTSQKEFKGFGNGIKNKGFKIMLKNMYKESFYDPQIKWNFTKFLIDRNGTVVARYEPTIEPEEIILDIEKLL